MSTAAASRVSTRALWIFGLLLALVLAGFLSYYASSSPDGLERVAKKHGFAKSARNHDLADSPVADYSVKGVDDTRLSGGLAGIIGVGVTLGVGSGVFWLVRRRGTSAANADSPTDVPETAVATPQPAPDPTSR
jgi:cobalt/nickel transport system permease protein